MEYRIRLTWFSFFCIYVFASKPIKFISTTNPDNRAAWVKTTAVNKDPFRFYVAEGTESIHDIIFISFGCIEELIRMTGLDHMTRFDPTTRPQQMSEAEFNGELLRRGLVESGSRLGGGLP